MRERWRVLQDLLLNAFPNEPMINWYVEFEPQDFRPAHGWRLYKDIL